MIYRIPRMHFVLLYLQNSWTALHCAAYWNHSEAVRVLLNLGADVSLLNKVCELLYRI